MHTLDVMGSSLLTKTTTRVSRRWRAEMRAWLDMYPPSARSISVTVPLGSDGLLRKKEQRLTRLTFRPAAARAHSRKAPAKTLTSMVL